MVLIGGKLLTLYKPIGVFVLIVRKLNDWGVLCAGNSYG